MSTNNAKLDATRMMGVFKDYLNALDVLRNDLIVKEEELKKNLICFYKIQGTTMNENDARNYLMSVSKSLDHCNHQINSVTHLKYIIIDGQIPIASMINNLKEFSINIDVKTLEMITDFWENIKYNLEMTQILIDQFDNEIFNRMKFLYVDSAVHEKINSQPSSDGQVVDFLRDIDRFAKQIPEKLTKSRLLIRSCGNHLRTHLLDRSTMSDRLLFGINVNQYPLLKVVPDLAFKLNQVFQICKTWIDREEIFIYKMNQQIRESKMLAKEKETRIISAYKHQKDILKSVKTSNLICQNTKRKLMDMSEEIKFLEAQILETKFTYKNLSEEKFRTMSMTNFLNLSISQTRRNYALQMKKQKLLNQVKQLETTLAEVDSQIYRLTHEIDLKSQEKTRAHEKLLSEEKAFNDAKLELETYSQNIHKYKSELNVLRQSLSAMESLQMLKTSPEFIENISSARNNEELSVQFAPSLKHSIDRKIGLNSFKQ